MADQLSERIVYAGLRRMTNDRSLIKQAYTHWQQTLSSKEFDVISIVSELVSYLDLSDQEKKTLMIALHAASNKLLDELQPVPGIISGNNGDNNDDQAEALDDPDTPAEKHTPHQKITQQYLQLFAQHVRKANAAEFTDFRQEVAENGLSAVNDSLSKVIANWAKEGMANLKLPNSIDESDCKSIAHQLYLLASEFVGPNTCDDIVVKAINHCLDMEETARFNPRDLV